MFLLSLPLLFHSLIHFIFFFHYETLIANLLDGRTILDTGDSGVLRLGLCSQDLHVEEIHFLPFSRII